MDDMPPNTSDTLDAWLQVSHTPGIGNRYFKRLIERFGSAEAILTASPDELAALSLPPATVERL
ncbi:MAG: DNA-protecting protein DprA, partial [Candidatus Thiodiazotropha weberae]|nr:DNA-protecting protein DprA [Candidatus Thiodiazotropha lotti]MCW4211887.1 DNA-protecting protein DprA [Candidatus Thiodiazotropha lotti]